MKNIFVSVLFMAVCCCVHAQANKMAEEDGTTVNKKPFTKSPAATRLIKSSLIDVGIYIDPAKWTATKASIGEDGEYNFVYKNKDINVVMLTETTGIPMSYVPEIILTNLQNMDPDASIVHKEYRTVNGVKLMFLHSSANMMKLNLNTYTYCYTDDSGTVQITAMIASQMNKEYAPIIESFLNGFVLLKKKK